MLGLLQTGHVASRGLSFGSSSVSAATLAIMALDVVVYLEVNIVEDYFIHE